VPKGIVEVRVGVEPSGLAHRIRSVAWRAGRSGLVAVVTLILVVSACGGAKSKASSPSPTRSTSSPTSTVTTALTTIVSTTSTPAASTTTLAAQAAPACRSTDVAVSAASGGVGLGHSAVNLLFKNTSTATCVLSGYPGVAGLDSTGHQVTQAVSLAPGQTASAKVEGTDNPVGTATSCPVLAGLLVTPPNTYASVRVPIAVGDCSGLQVHPVVEGDTGNQQS
jgi:hypothetical protein